MYFIEPDRIIDIIDYSDLSQYTLTCTDSELIATDIRSHTVSVFDYETLEVTHTLWRYGRGPGEFYGPYKAAFDDNHLYIYDSGNQNISLFSRENWSFDTSLSVGTNMSRFVVSLPYIYKSSRFENPEKPFMKMNIEGGVEYFGESTGHHFFGRNIFDLLKHRENIVAVSRTEPIVRLYNLSGDLLGNYNLGNEKELSETLDFAHQFYREFNNQNRFVVLIRDAAVFEDYLVLNISMRPGGRLKTNTYLVFEIDEEQLEKVSVFETNIGSNGVLTTICIHENRLYSNGGQGALNLYEFDLSFLIE
ncbi:MAG: hypothetical protein JJU13_11870 [Balneolaceae bacterium]|nr:hypothetical protein [Balneolaceae bacterium]